MASQNFQQFILSFLSGSISGSIGPHASSHSLTGSDPVYLYKSQILDASSSINYNASSYNIVNTIALRNPLDNGSFAAGGIQFDTASISSGSVGKSNMERPRWNFGVSTKRRKCYSSNWSRTTY
jgi:hypothetical protein